MSTYFDGDTITLLETLDILADFCHDGAELVAECERDLVFGDGMGSCWTEVWAAEIFVEVSKWLLARAAWYFLL